MPDILHRVEVKASPTKVYGALSTQKGLASWWTADTQGGFNVGGEIKFRFGTLGGFDMKVLELEPETRVLWQVVAGPEEWVGTRVSFELETAADCTTIMFKHQGWKDPVEFMHHCSTKWAVYLLSIKSLVETGKGAPFPEDVHITVNAD